MKTFREHTSTNDVDGNIDHVSLMKHHKKAAIEALRKNDHDAAAYHSKEFVKHEEALKNDIN